MLSFTLVILTFCVIGSILSFDKKSFSDLNKSEQNLLHKNDLYNYVESLHRIIQFCSENKIDIDMNLEFGLFLTNVNLKVAVKNKFKKLPKTLLRSISGLLHANNELINFFNVMVDNNEDPREEANKMILSIFSNETNWMNRIRKFKKNLPIHEKREKWYNRNKFKSITIYEYIDRISKYNESVPSPKLSDMCFRSLASNVDHQLRSSSRCSLFEPCYQALLKGSDFGYALSHRLLLLINARLGRGCYILSPNTDKMLTRRFCKIAYDEIQFVTTERYEIIDLILELITLCALDGHAQFLRQDWLRDSLRFQATEGCFGVTIPKDTSTDSAPTKRSKEWKLAKTDHRLLGERCDGHVTSVAAGVLSAAIRYILESYY